MNIYETFTDVVTQGELILFRVIWNTSNDNMFIVRKDGNEYISESANNALKKTFNITDDKVCEVPLKTIMDKKTYEKISNRYDQCISSNEIMSYEETNILDSSGVRHWETTIIPVIDKQNNIVRIFGTSKEITQFKKINEILELEVKKRTLELEDTLDKLKKISVTDKLTTLYNRHHLDSLLEDTKKIINRYENNYGIIILDLDNFKNINDSFGHHVGDVVLKEFSLLLKNSIRETDTIGRWGGDEFLIIVPFATKDSLESLLNNIKNKIQKFEFSYVKKLTSSLGATLIKKDDTPESFISRADKAMYKAKNEGKDKIEILL